ncbi:MAG: hypothetical protein JEZ09_21685, partial [Salinivirgaceae bacterium]|nr:hypothetical protein [Salinivirgaceae bacterium]
MATRRLPRSVSGITTALRAAKTKADAIGDIAKIAFSALVYERLTGFLPNFETEVNERQEALVNQTTATA